MFGPPYQKINSLWKRHPDGTPNKGVVMPGHFSCLEFDYLKTTQWDWFEKIDGTNIRLNFNGETVSIGGRTDKAQIPVKLFSALEKYTLAADWQRVFPETDDDVWPYDTVTIYGEGYGAGIQRGGGNYGPEQDFIVFDIRIGDSWLEWSDVLDIAGKLGMKTVPYYGGTTLLKMWDRIVMGEISSTWQNVEIEGVVGRPVVQLRDKHGHRIITKMKVKDWTDFERSRASG